MQMTIPPKFVDGCQGDMVEARRRWDITRAWREEYDLDHILEKPHPTFDIIKKCVLCGDVGVLGGGSDCVWFVRSGLVE